MSPHNSQKIYWEEFVITPINMGEGCKTLAWLRQLEESDSKQVQIVHQDVKHGDYVESDHGGMSLRY